MQNAPTDGISYLSLPTQLPRAPEALSDLLFEEPYSLPLAFLTLVDPPPGQVRLLEPWPIPEDPEAARELEHDIQRRRGVIGQLLIAGEFWARRRQASQFGFFTRKMLWQRFHCEAFLYCPTASIWSARFGEPSVIESVRELQERHGDVLVAVDLSADKFELLGPKTRGRRGAMVASLAPVLEALAMWGLWLDQPDERFRDLARAMVRLAQDEHRRIGRTEFIRRCGRGEQ